MSEPTRGEVDDLLRARSKSDPGFRATLLKDPKAVLEGLGAKFPPDLTINTVEETSNTLYVVVPSAQLPGELSESALEAVSGGGQATGGAGSGKTKVGEISIMKVLDKSSPLLI
jgi:hypothetical protein